MTRPELIAALTGEGWKDATEPWTPGNAYISADSELRLDIEADGSWELRTFTDSDVDTEWGPQAVGRYRTIEGGSLEDVLVAVKCTGMGIPRDVDERDLGPEVDDGGVDDVERENDRRIL